MAIFVRPVVAQDWPALRQVFLTSRRHSFPWLAVDDFTLMDLDEQTVGEVIWVAQDTGGEVAGFISLWEVDHFIHHLYVAEAYHRRGVGQMLLQSLPRWNEQRYELKCLQRNDKALAFYKAQGFIITGEGGEGGNHHWVLERGRKHDNHHNNVIS